MSLEKFSSRISTRAENLGAIINGIVIKTVLVVDQSLVLSTPVDTGKARSNWLVSLDAPITAEIAPYAPGENLGRGESSNAQGALNQAQAAVGRRVLGQPVFITNNVDYIADLNAGTSRQAPEMFVQAAIIAGVAAVASSPINTSKRP